VKKDWTFYALATVLFTALITLGTIVSGHSQYQVKVDTILKTHGPWKTVQVQNDVAWMLNYRGQGWQVINQGINEPTVGVSVE
jgi:hypothetical protein